jgi:1-acyl-sn-glycerol-3-phosphate acyltransferase
MQKHTREDKPMFSRHFFKPLRRLFFNARIHGAGNLKSDEPVIIVSNHVGTYGPVSVITSLPTRLYPWVSHEVTDLATVSQRVQKEFLEQELHLRPPLSEFLSRVIGRICVALMKDLGAIPVYTQGRRIKGTVEKSLALLEQGKNILVFAEDSTRKINDALCEFCTGFIHVAKLYYESTRKAVQFLPIAVNKAAHGILIGKPIRFDGTIPFPEEKRRLKAELETTVAALYAELAAEHDHRKRHSA